MNEIKKFLGLFVRVFVPCIYGITTVASLVGGIAIFLLAPIWAWLSLLIIIPLGLASCLRLYQFAQHYINDD